MTDVSDELWKEFHRVVNMTSAELRDWLRTQTSGETTESFPDESHSLGMHVLGILGKRRTDLTPDDARAMEVVVDRIRAERGEEPEPAAGDDSWRRQLMCLGHDPMKP